MYRGSFLFFLWILIFFFGLVCFSIGMLLKILFCLSENVFNFFFELFIYLFWPCQVFLAGWRPSLVAEDREYSLAVVHGPLIAVASRCGA